MSLLGVIATFTVPKIMAQSEHAKQESVLKETFGLLSDIAYQFNTERRNPTEFSSYVVSKVSALKSCSTNSITEGCVSGSTRPMWAWFAPGPGVLLVNGAYIDLAWSNGSTSPVQALMFDWNGNNPPNQLGEDVFVLHINVVDYTVGYAGVWIKRSQVICADNGAGTTAWRTNCLKFLN